MKTDSKKDLLANGLKVRSPEKKRNLLLLCEICRQEISSIDQEVLDQWGVTPSAFRSKAPERSVPEPFVAAGSWHDFRCPYCSKFPFIYDPALVDPPSRILTSDGFIPVKSRKEHG